MGQSRGRIFFFLPALILLAVFVVYPDKYSVVKFSTLMVSLHLKNMLKYSNRKSLTCVDQRGFLMVPDS